MALCATTALAGAVPRLCVRGARGRFGGFGPVPGVVSLLCPPPRPACSALRVAGRPVRVSLTLARWYAIPRGLCVPRARSGCPSGSPRVSLSCVCARTLAVSAPPPAGWCGARISRGPGTGHWALGGVVRAPPRVLPRSLAPFGVLGGGRSGPGSPLLGWGLWGWRQGVPGGGAFYRCVGRLGSCAPPPPTARPLGGLSGSAIHVLWARACGRVGPALSLWGLRAAGRVRCVHMLEGELGGGGGGGVHRTPRLRGRGGACRAGGRSASFRPSAFPGQATKRASLALCCPWGAWPPIPLRFVLTRLLWVRSVRRPGAQAWARLFFAAPMGAGGWGGGAGRTPAPLSGGGGPSPPPRGVGTGAPAAGGPVGGRGGGGGVSRRGLPALLPGGGPRYSILAPSVWPARSLPACACGRG